jgi:RNA polymerase sigma-70 factor (ECF subfamily)
VTERSGEDPQAAFEQLFRQTRIDLLAYILRRSQSVEDAADVLAETYLIAWQKLDVIPTGDRTRPWLFGVARNLLVKGATRRRSHHALIERLASEMRASRSIPWSDGDTRIPALRAALGGLSETDREILTLTAWEGLTPKQIARVMGVSANVTRVRLHRARRRLRRRLSPQRAGSCRAEYVAIERNR